MTKWRRWGVLVLGLAVPTTGWAQIEPQPQEQPTQIGQEQPPPPAEEQPPPPAEEPPPPDLNAPRWRAPRMGDRETAPSPRSGESERPEGLSVGIGVGYDFPADLQMPDAAAVRFRFASGLTLEPFATLGASGESTDFEGDDVSEASTTQLGVGANVLFPLTARGPVDLVVIGGARLDSVSQDPDGDDNNVTTTAFSLGWGLGLELWLSSHWLVNLSAMNPFVTYTATTEQQGEDEATTSTWAAGLIFDPDVALMVHLFLQLARLRGDAYIEDSMNRELGLVRIQCPPVVTEAIGVNNFLDR